MIDYDAAQPLIFIHTPKTAGSSVLGLMERWFGAGLLLHYYHESLSEMPVRHDIFGKHCAEQPVAVYGHFNRRRGFGVEDYYPEARQFITVLRDPLERLISNYFYLKKVAHGWKKYPTPIDPDLEQYVLSNRSVMLNYFPRPVTADNYKELIEKYFIEIGIVEELGVSMTRIAAKLNRPYAPEMLECINATERDQLITADVRDRFIEDNLLEYTVFNYVREKFK